MKSRNFDICHLNYSNSLLIKGFSTTAQPEHEHQAQPKPQVNVQQAEVHKEEAPPQQTIKSYLDALIRQSCHFTRDMCLDGYKNEMYDASTLFQIIFFYFF